MQTYPEYPVNDHANIERIIKELNEILEREAKRPGMYEHLTSSMRSLLEDEIIPALENEINWEPSDDDLGYGGEPPMTADEMHTAAWQQHQELHR
jgi:hypothetical protein